MALGAYDIRFILSVQDRTRNSFTRLANDMNRLNKVERQAVKNTKQLSEQLHVNSAVRNDVQRRINRETDAITRNDKAMQQAIKRRKQLAVQIRDYNKALTALTAQEKDQRSIIKKNAKAPAGTSGALRREAAQIRLNKVIPEQRAIFEARRQMAAMERGRLFTEQMGLGKAIKAMQFNVGRMNVELLATNAQERLITQELLKQEAILERQAALRQRWRTGMDVGRSMQIRGLLMTAGASIMAQQAANFQTAATKAATQISGQGAQNPEVMLKNSARLQKDILSMMGQFPAKAQEMNDAAYQIFSAMNVGYNGGVKLLELFNMLSVAGMTDLATATNAGITLFNNFARSGEDAGKMMDTVFATIRLGRMEFGDFNDMLNQLAPTAKATGQSLEDIGGAAAFVTSRIPSQRQSATSIARLLEVMARSDFKSGAAKLGAPITDAKGGLLPLPKVIQQLARIPITQTESGLNDLIPAITRTGRGGGRGIQSTIQARRALALLIKQMQAYLDIQKQVENADNEFVKRYKVMIGQPAVQWERLKSQLQAVAIVMGQALLPVLVKVGEWFARGLEWAQQNEGMLRWIAIVFGAVAAVNLFGGAIISLVSAAMILKIALGGGLTRIIAGLISRAGLPALAGAAGLTAARFIKAAGAAWLFAEAVNELNKQNMNPVPGWLERNNLGWLSKSAKWLGDHLPGSMLFPAEDEKKPGKKKKVAKSLQEQYKELVKELDKLSKQGFSKKMMDNAAKAFGYDPAAFERWISGEDAASKKRQIAVEIADAAKDIRKQVSTALESIYTQYKTENESLMGGLFQGPWMNSDRFKWFEQFGVGPTIQDMTKDMNAQTFAFGKTRKQLDSLTKRGLPDGLMKELKAMGIDGSKYIDVLAKATGPEFKRFVQAWNKRKKELERATDKDFQRHIDKWTRQGKSLAQGLADGFSTESDHMRQVISTTIDNAFAGAIKQMAAVQVAAQRTAEAVANAFTIPPWLMATGGAGATAAGKATKGGRQVIPKVYSYAPGNYQQYWGGYGNPGVMGRAGRPRSIEDIIAGSGPGLGMRGLSSTGDTNIYNITGFSPDEAYRDAERRRAFRMRNKRRS